MTLGQLENMVLFALQSPGTNFTAGFPNWAAITNPQYPQAAVDHYLNLGYRRVLADTVDFAPVLVSQQIVSTQNTYKYAIPAASPSGYPTVLRVQRVQYAPAGMNYTKEFRRGREFISWDKFQHLYTGEGFLQNYAFGTVPSACAVFPDRKTLYFYPGSKAAGDTITVWYTPIPTAGSTVCSLLSNETDVPILPDDMHEAILQWALSQLWIRARDPGQSDAARAAYNTMIASYRTQYLQVGAGDTFGFQEFSPNLGLENGL